MLVERSAVSGAYVVSAIVGGHLVSRRYYGFNKKEAVREYRDEMGLNRKRKEGKK